MFNLGIKSEARKKHRDLLRISKSLQEQPHDPKTLYSKTVDQYLGGTSFTAPPTVTGYAESRAKSQKRELCLADIVYGLMIYEKGVFDSGIVTMSRRSEKTLDAIEKAVSYLPTNKAHGSDDQENTAHRSWGDLE